MAKIKHPKRLGVALTNFGKHIMCSRVSWSHRFVGVFCRGQREFYCGYEIHVCASKVMSCLQGWKTVVIVDALTVTLIDFDFFTNSY